MNYHLRHDWQSAARIAALVAVTGLVAACSSPMSSSRRFSEPPANMPRVQNTPVQNSTVSSTALPPLDGNGQQQTQQGGGYYTQDGTYVPAGSQQAANGQQQQVMTTPDGRIITSGAQQGMQNQQTGFPNDGSFASQDPMVNGGGFGSSVSTQDQQVAIDPTGAPTQVASRDLSGGLTADKLLGSWTVISGADQCRVNLTQTAASGTERFRASAPNCTIEVLSGVASWQLAGTQVQFFSEGGQLIAALLQSGNRFIGTLSGGRGISMAG